MRCNDRIQHFRSPRQTRTVVLPPDALRRGIFTAKRPAEQVNLIGQDANVVSDIYLTGANRRMYTLCCSFRSIREQLNLVASRGYSQLVLFDFITMRMLKRAN